jgi:hypothetical protein
MLLSGFLFLNLSLQAQLVSVETSLSSDSMVIGDQLLFRIHVAAANGVTFQMPVVKDTLNGEIEVLFVHSADTSGSRELIEVDHTYIITGFTPGLQVLPAQPVVYSYHDITDTALSMSLMLAVYDPMVDTTQQIKPIKPPINTPVTLREVFPWVMMGMGGWMIGTLVAALIWIYMQRRRDPEIFSLKPLEPAHVIAFRELDRLKEQKLWESGQVKLFYTRLTEISRRYIERQYGIPAMERTTEEILEAFRRSNTDDHLLDEMLKELLELADLVKFAKEDPLPVENQTNLNNAYLFVQKTYPMFSMEKALQTEEEKQDG